MREVGGSPPAPRTSEDAVPHRTRCDTRSWRCSRVVPTSSLSVHTQQWGGVGSFPNAPTATCWGFYGSGCFGRLGADPTVGVEVAKLGLRMSRQGRLVPVPLGGICRSNLEKRVSRLEGRLFMA